MSRDRIKPSFFFAFEKRRDGDHVNRQLEQAKRAREAAAEPALRG